MMRYCLGFARVGGEVLLILKERPKWQAGRWNGIGGKLDDGETPAEGMSREMREETGLVIMADQWRHVLTMGGDSWEVFVFTCDSTADKLREARSLTDESVAVHREKFLPRAVISNVPWMLAMCDDSDLRGRSLYVRYLE